MIGQNLICHFCQQTVDVASACTDEQGKAVHSDCYAKAIMDSIPLIADEESEPPTAA